MTSSVFHACVDIGGTKVAVSLADAQSAATRTLHACMAEPNANESANDELAQQHRQLRPFVLNQGMVKLAILMPLLTQACALVPIGLGLQVGDFGVLALTKLC